MKKNRVASILCVVVMLCLLSGCSLAQKSESANAQNATGGTGDRLIGVFITTKPLDLFDDNGYVNDNIDSIMSGKTPSEETASKYEGRLYATKLADSGTSHLSSETTDAPDFSFKGVPGFAFFAPTTGKGADSCTESVVDAAVSNVSFDVSGGDQKQSLTLKGTIYLSATSKDRIFYSNPVYQTSSDKVYLMGGDGMNFEADNQVGDLGSLTKSETDTIKENSKSTTYSMKVTVDVNAQFAPQKIVVVQIDANTHVLSRTEYQPDAMPGTLTATRGAVALIVETHAQTTTGTPQTTRKLYDRGVESFDTLSARTDGILLSHETKVTWK